MATVFIGLGTNLGNKRDNLKNARDKILSNYPISLTKESSIEETDPVDFLEQPKFLNQIILIETDIEPFELLNILKKIESELGRKVLIPKGPRIIDLDILLYDDLLINTEKLNIPHPGIKKRRFILKHLIEIEPDLIDPIKKKRYSETYDKLKEVI